jgi:glycosyltransferase
MGLSYGVGIGPLVGKIITEIGMFFFNWFVQKKVIFGQEKGVHYVK